MIIIQISDLHLTDAQSAEKARSRFKKIEEALEPLHLQDKNVIFCICGDIVDKGGTDGYKFAIDLFEYLRSLIKTKSFSIVVVPGNHDLENKSISKFNEMVKVATHQEQCVFDKSSVVLHSWSGGSFFLVNSAFRNDYEFGDVDIETLEPLLDEAVGNKVVMVHHSIVNRGSDDKSSIRNSYSFVRLLIRHNVNLLLHGHTHGYCDMTVGTSCLVAGVGPFFGTLDDINSQFNVINLVNGIVLSVDNYIYRSDLDRFTCERIYKSKPKKLYDGNSIKSVYDDVVNHVATYNSIHCVNIAISAKIDSLVQELDTYFAEDKATARLWLNKDVPSELYYNHGMYLYKDNALGKMTDELIKKATSSRAIVPLLYLEELLRSNDDFLPSLDLIQCGFQGEEKNELFVSFYLRALEVKHFLRINIAEAVLLATIVKNEIPSVERVSINFFAFRVQAKERFSCFKKAKIDMLRATELYELFRRHNASELICLLSEKIELAETVVQDSGLLKLKEAFADYLRFINDGFFDKEFEAIINNAITSAQTLRSERRKSSKYVDLKRHEHNLDQCLRTALDHLSRLQQEG